MNLCIRIKQWWISPQGLGIQLRNRLRNYILYVPITIKNKNNIIQMQYMDHAKIIHSVLKSAITVTEDLIELKNYVGH